MPNGTPGVGDDILIGNLQTAQNSMVLVAPPGYGYDYRNITDGMIVDHNGAELVSFGFAQVSGAGSKIIARPAPGPNQYDFQGPLQVGIGSELMLMDNVQIRLFDKGFNDGIVSGRGTSGPWSTSPMR